MIIINKIKFHWQISIIVFIAIALRLMPIMHYQFSYDELSSLNRTIFENFNDTINYGVKIDAHPALVQVFLWLWVKLFGYNEIALKLPFLVCGTLSVWQIYVLANKYYGKQTGLIAATVLACSFIFLIYSSYIRMYISGVFFSVLLLKYALAIMFKLHTTKKEYVLFCLSALLCAYNHHISCLFAFTVGALVLVYFPKQKTKNYLLCCVFILLAYAPHLHITLYQFSKAGVGANVGGWLPAPRNTELYYFTNAVLGTGTIGNIVIALFMALILFFISKKITLSKQQHFLFFIFIINYAIIHLYSVYRSPILQYSVLLFCGIALILFLSSFAKALSNTQTYLFCALLICLLSFQSIYSKKTVSTAHKQSFNMQAQAYSSLQKTNLNKKVFGIFSGDKFYPYVYEKKYHQKMNYVLNSDSVFETPQTAQRFVEQINADYLILSDANPFLVELAKQKFPFIKSHQQSYFYNIMVLSKYKNDECKTQNFSINTINVLANNLFTKLETKLTPKNNCYVLDSLTGEYSFAIKSKFSKFNAREGQWLMAEVDFETDSLNPTTEDLLAISINTTNGIKNYFTAAKFSDFKRNNKNNKLYLQVFVGSDVAEWNNNGEFVCFIWKKDKSPLRITNFNIKILDYNPDKWTLWN